MTTDDGVSEKESKGGDSLSIGNSDGITQSLASASAALTTVEFTNLSSLSIAEATKGLARYSMPDLSGALQSIQRMQFSNVAIYEQIRSQVSLSAAGTRASALMHQQVTESLRKLTDLANQRSLMELVLQQKSTLETYTSFASWMRSYYPANWQVGRPLLGQAMNMAMNEGIVTAWVPSGQPLQRLLGAQTGEARLRVLALYRSKILADCDDALTVSSIDKEDPHVIALQEAIRAARARHWMSSQALASNVIESWIREVHPQEGIPRNRGKTTKRIVAMHAGNWRDSSLGIPAILVYGAVNYALQDFNGNPDFRIGFNRHVTAHVLRSNQYSISHTIQAIMMATALLVATAEGHLSTAPEAESA